MNNKTLTYLLGMLILVLAFNLASVAQTNCSGGILACVIPGATFNTSTLAVTFPGVVTSGSNFTLGSSGFYNFNNGRGQMTAPAAGILTIDNNAQSVGIRLQYNASPTVSGCASGAVTTGSSDTAGKVTASDTSCTVIFGSTWASTPFIVAVNNSRVAGIAVTTAGTTLFVVTGLTAGDAFTWHAIGPRS